MTHTRIQLEQELAALEQLAARLLAEHEDPAEFWPAFAGPADAFIANGAPADWEWADQQLEDMKTCCAVTAHLCVVPREPPCRNTLISSMH